MTTTYIIEGMTCGGCVNALTRAIGKELPGAEVKVDLATHRVDVTPADTAAVERAALAAGFEFKGEAA